MLLDALKPGFDNIQPAAVVIDGDGDGVHIVAHRGDGVRDRIDAFGLPDNGFSERADLRLCFLTARRAFRPHFVEETKNKEE